MNGDEGQHYKAPPPPSGAREREGGSTTTNYAVCHHMSATKGVQDELAPSLLVLLLFTTGLDPLKQTVVTAAAKGKGALA